MAPWYYKRNGDVAKAATVIMTDDEVVCPALWKDRTLVAYSKTGFANRKIRVPSNWIDVQQVQLSLITLRGIQGTDTLPVDHGIISLTLKPETPLVITALQP